MADDLAGSIAPVVEAPAAPAAPAPSSPANSPAAPVEGNQSEKPEKTYSQSDFEKAIQSRRAKDRRSLERQIRAEVERDHYRQIAEGRTTQQEPPQAKGKPQAKDFSDVDSYMDALTDWKLEQREAKQAKEWQERQPKEQAAEQEQRFAQSLAQKLAPGPEKHDDFEDVVYADGVEWTPAMIGYIHESEDPVELAYQLGLRRDELRRISQLPPARQPAEVYKFEAKLKEPPKTTAAPPPIVPGTATASGARKDWSQMTTAEHVKAWAARKKR